ncbi:MAG: nucleoside monophosphate kinase [Candidatus Nomurabacteria bacterium]|jgi:adenylate kinase|nr:nucleoside monophosphate kinase [Candidatus Nomurabacteria bacterium]
MEDSAKIKLIKSWLGSGSVNVFGVPFAGKDTVCTKLSEILGAEFISSGDIIRSNSGLFSQKAIKETNNGTLTPTEEFKQIVLPFFGRASLSGKALVLSSVGRWTGEEYPTMNTLIKYNHPTKLVLVLELSKDEVLSRWKIAQEIQDRDGGIRKDDATAKIVKRRIKEYETKTLPVVNFYARLGLAYKINAAQPREKVLQDCLDTLLFLAKR